MIVRTNHSHEYHQEIIPRSERPFHVQQKYWLTHLESIERNDIHLHNVDEVPNKLWQEK